jgi:hypothetical protein
MISHHQTDQSRPTPWPRARNMPLCSLRSNSMVAPEASALNLDGKISYLWSCDSCGQGFVTHAAIWLNRPSSFRTGKLRVSVR